VRFVDTNVLIYSISRNPVDARKREIADELLESDDLALSVQVLQEFYTQATRVTRPRPLSHAMALEFIDTWSRFPVQAITMDIMKSALDIKAMYRFNYWDCAIIAAARELGCDQLLTEDLSHGQIIEGTTVVNPFREV
jgi:predicted nucleic acid-binding protein